MWLALVEASAAQQLLGRRHDGTNPRASRLADMKTSAKHIGEHLRRIFATVTKRPLQWSQIDALATLEEKEEARRLELAAKSQRETKPQSGGEV